MNQAACSFNDDDRSSGFSIEKAGGYEFHCYQSSANLPLGFSVGKLVRFMGVANAIAQMSRDPSTKVGALIFGPGYEIRSSGWNGAPRGCKADTDERYTSRDEKLWWVAHAELNAITNAARTGTPTEGCALLATHMPCMKCAVAIVQAGISVVVCPDYSVGFSERWAADIERTKRLFYETGVSVVTYLEIENEKID